MVEGTGFGDRWLQLPGFPFTTSTADRGALRVGIESVRAAGGPSRRLIARTTDLQRLDLRDLPVSD
jgi:hypothetical protein